MVRGGLCCQLVFRCTKSERRELEQAARKKECSLAAMIRMRCCP